MKISFSNEFRLKVYGATQCLPNRPRFTTRAFDRGSVFMAACSMMVARAHMYPAQCMAAAVQQPEGWRIVDPPPCLGGLTHRWVPVDTHSTRVLERDGCGWGPCDQTAQQYSAETPQTFCLLFFFLWSFSFVLSFFSFYFFFSFFFPFFFHPLFLFVFFFSFFPFFLFPFFCSSQFQPRLL